MLLSFQVTCKPMAGVIQERIKKLQESTVNDNVILRVLANIGLSNHGILDTTNSVSGSYLIVDIKFIMTITVRSQSF